MDVLLVINELNDGVSPPDALVVIDRVTRDGGLFGDGPSWLGADSAQTWPLTQTGPDMAGDGFGDATPSDLVLPGSADASADILF